MKHDHENKKYKWRFGLVGIANTGIDFGLYSILVLSGLNVIFSNYISTSAAIVFSYIANGKYTFRDDENYSVSKLIKFLAVTLTAAWVIQPLVILSAQTLLNTLEIEISFEFILVKILAAAVGLVWNYYLYKEFVYKTDKH